MSTTQHIGYGCFQLGDFAPGEVFMRQDGGVGRVCDPQPPLTEQIAVWLDYGTSNTRRELLHRSALAYAVNEEQAWHLERRRKERSDGLSRLA